jgi:hypothetical protein
MPSHKCVTRRSERLTRVPVWVALLVLAGLAIAQSAMAHHSIAGQFDMNTTLQLNGVVSRVDWANPHVYLYLDVNDAEGERTTWKLETLPVAMLRKAGITKQMLMNGERVVMEICPARDGTSRLGFILNVKYPDGRVFQFNRNRNAPAQVGQR